MITQINFKSLFLLLLAASIYALIFPVNLISIQNGATTFGNTFWQTFTGGMILLLFNIKKKNKTFLISSNIKSYLVVGAFGFGFPLALFTAVGANLPVFLTSIVMALSPTFTYFFSILLKKERISILGLLGIFLGLLGVIFLVTPEKIIPNSTTLIWFLLALIVPIFYAIANMAASILSPKETSDGLIGSGYLLGAALTIFPFMIIFDQFYFPLLLNLILLTISGGIINAVFIILFIMIIKTYGPTFFSQFNYLAVIFAIAWASLFFSQQTPLIAFLSLLLMSIGIIISQLKVKKD